MKLTKQDADLFFKLMNHLLYYVNHKVMVFPKASSFERYKKLTTEQKIKIRNKLYERIELIDQFVSENPNGFSVEELQIVQGWKKFREGNFFIERHLKKFSVFIDDDKVYAVLALNDSFEDVIPKSYLPTYVETTLLPFKGKIVYDGFLLGNNIFFGGGVKFELKEAYMRAKQKGEVIMSFDPAIQASKKRVSRKPGKDYHLILQGISEQAKQLRSSGGAPAVYGPAFSLAKAGIEFAKMAVEHPDDLDSLWKALGKVERALEKTDLALYRMR